MNQKYSHILLNGETILPDAISAKLSAISSSTPAWEKELYEFLNEWFSGQDYVTAQTSGSTGEPKPISLSKNIMIKSAERTIQYFALKKDDRLLLSLSCRYIAGKMMVVRAIVGQMNLVTVDPTTDFSFLQQEKFEFGALVPNQVFKLLEQPNGNEKLQHIQNLLIGGSAISSDLAKQISQLSTRVVSTYGMTETASHIAIRELSGKQKSAFYVCLPGISVGLDDRGCLKISIPEIKEPLQTNDLAELLPNNCFHILGRADSVIISGGIKYSPETIEKKLEDLIRGRRFVISSIHDDRLGQKLVLVIEGNPFAIEHLHVQLQKALSSYEQPRKILFLDKFPETTSGKVKRNEIREFLNAQKT